MFVRLTDLDNSCTFVVDDTEYIKIGDISSANENWTIAIDKNPLSSVDVMKKSGIKTLGQRIYDSLPGKSSCSEHSEMIDVRRFAKYKGIITLHIHDCWYVEWTNKAQNKNGDCCYIDANGNYGIINERKKNELLNGNGKLNTRLLHWFCPDTIVEISERKTGQ